ncbi:hypothetical protein ACVBE9_03760 [Eionea flava]
MHPHQDPHWQNKRIAVSGSLITETIYQLNAQEKIVGVDSTSQYPR